MLIGRGGGASEDLSAFNDETLVRAIASSKMPVIACIGHEIDSTLVDFVADKRASTPTGAAELATVDQREIIQHLAYAINDMEENIKGRLLTMEEDLSSYKEDLNSSLLNLVKQQSQLLAHKKVTLEALNPNNVINRGYSLTLDEKGKPISAKTMKIGQKIKTILKDGTVYSEVQEVEDK